MSVLIWAAVFVASFPGRPATHVLNFPNSSSVAAKSRLRSFATTTWYRAWYCTQSGAPALSAVFSCSAAVRSAIASGIRRASE